MRCVPLVLVMAVGPGERLGALEVLDSARVFFEGPYRVVVVDDSGEIGTWRALARYAEVDILHNWRRRGLARLLASLQRAYRHVLSRYDFEAVLKVDTDALITGPGLDADILAALRGHPEAGMAGSRSWHPDWARRLEENMPMWGPLIHQAEQHGYRRGESVFGGAYVLSRRCLAALDAGGFLRLTPTGPRIGEDVTFSLCVRSLGYELHNLGGPEQPFAMAWRELPMPPREILSRGKKVVHAVKFSPNDLASRAVFARARRRAVLQLRSGSLDGARTVALAHRTARLRGWLRWRAIGTQALREDRPRRARRIFRRCIAIVPPNLEAWLGLAASMLPGWLYRLLRLARVHGIRALRGFRPR